MTAEKAVGGYVVTTGRFTKDAVVFALNKQIELIEGSKLEKMLDSDLNKLTSNNVVPVSEEGNICPRCGNELVKRMGTRGEFLGCSSFPKCRYTRG